MGWRVSSFMGVSSDGRCERKCNYVHRGAFRKSAGAGIYTGGGRFAGRDLQWGRRRTGPAVSFGGHDRGSGLGVRERAKCTKDTKRVRGGRKVLDMGINDKGIAKERALVRSCGYVYSSIHISRRKSIQELNTWADFFESTAGRSVVGLGGRGCKVFCTGWGFAPPLSLLQNGSGAGRGRKWRCRMWLHPCRRAQARVVWRGVCCINRL